MSYIDVAYVKDRVRERLLTDVTDDTEPLTGAIVDAKIINAITTIEARLNIILRKIYTIPLTKNSIPDTTAYEDSLEVIKDLILRNVMFLLHIQANIQDIPQEYIDAKLEFDDLESGKTIFNIQGIKLVSNLTNMITSNKLSTDKIYNSDLWKTY